VGKRADIERELARLQNQYGPALEKIDAHDAAFDTWLCAESGMTGAALEKVLHELSDVRCDRKVFREQRDLKTAQYEVELVESGMLRDEIARLTARLGRMAEPLCAMKDAIKKVLAWKDEP
jgi:hypothetical protein